MKRRYQGRRYGKGERFYSHEFPESPLKMIVLSLILALIIKFLFGGF